MRIPRHLTMGIDIYARWKGQTEAEEDAQYAGFFSILHGHAGYLREVYHGEPYATKYLAQEAFEHPEGGAQIPAAVLRQRLAHTLALVTLRQERVYDEQDLEAILEVHQSFEDFVALCERKEQETGEPVTIIASY
jgi:hypothetical protein